MSWPAASSDTDKRACGCTVTSVSVRKSAAASERNRALGVLNAARGTVNTENAKARSPAFFFLGARGAPAQPKTFLVF